MPNTAVRKQRVVLATILEDSHQPPELDLASIHNCSFTVVNKIGQGGYGHVFIVEKNQGIDKKDIYAMKVKTLIHYQSCYSFFSTRLSTRAKFVANQRKWNISVLNAISWRCLDIHSLLASTMLSRQQSNSFTSWILHLAASFSIDYLFKVLLMKKLSDSTHQKLSAL